MHLYLGIESKVLNSKHIHLSNKHLIYTTCQLLFYILAYGSAQGNIYSPGAHFLWEVKQSIREANKF